MSQNIGQMFGDLSMIFEIEVAYPKTSPLPDDDLGKMSYSQRKDLYIMTANRRKKIDRL